MTAHRSPHRRRRGQPKASRSRSSSGSRRAALGGEQVEGRRAVLELLRARRRAVKSLVLAQGQAESALLTEIEESATRLGVVPRRVALEELRARAHTDVPQGVVATAEPVQAVALESIIDRNDAFAIALDGVTDPQNLGSILRTADAAGATGVVVPAHRSARLTPAAMKAAAGAAEHVPIAVVPGIPAALEQASRAECALVALDERGDVELFDLAVGDDRVVLVLGAEGKGISRLARERCDVVAHIPMHGSLESLNVGAATAVACFEIARHRAQS